MAAPQEKFLHKSAILRPLSVQGRAHRLLLDTRYRGTAFMPDEIYHAEKITGKKQPVEVSEIRFLTKQLFFSHAQHICSQDCRVANIFLPNFQLDKFLIKIVIERECIRGCFSYGYFRDVFFFFNKLHAVFVKG